MELKYSKEHGEAVVSFLNDNGFLDCDLIGSLAKIGFSDHDIDIHVRNSGTREDRDKLISLFGGTVDETDWGGLYFSNTQFGDVDIFFSIDGFDY